MNWSCLGCSVLCIALLGACGAHVQLQIPPPHASQHERQAAYQRLAPDQKRNALRLRVVGTVVSSKPPETLALRDGTLVHYPEDLAPAIARDPLAATALRSGTLRKRGRGFKALSLLFVGAAVVLGSLAVSSFGDESDDSRAPTYGFATLGALTGAVLSYLFGAVASHNGTVYQTQVFRGYDQALRRQLGVR